jgi:hypothetical protein
VRNRALVQDDATDVASVPQPPPLAAVAGEPLRSQRELTKHGDQEGGKAAGGGARSGDRADAFGRRILPSKAPLLAMAKSSVR